MQNVQRHIGKYMKRSADDQHVSILLKDFEDADQLLAKIVDASKAWREAWISILTYQARLFNEFEILYSPILGAADDYQGHVPLETPKLVIARTSRLRTESDDLRRDLKDVVDQVEVMIIRPAQEAKDNMQAFKKKTIKRREDKKLDYERYQSRVETSQKKTKRSERDNAALSKAEKELETSTEQYKAADEHLRHVLPPLLQAVYSLQPYILAAQIQIQNSLLGHYYTSLHTYCSQEGFPNPSPPMDEIIRIWDDVLRPIQKEAETIGILAAGKAVRLSLQQQNGNGQTNGYRRPSQTSNPGRQQSISPARAIGPGPSTSTPLLTDIPTRPKIQSSNSTSLLTHHQLVTSPNDQALVRSPSPSYSAYATPLTTLSSSTNTDYFSRGRQPSQPTASTAVSPSALVSLTAGKKKPPPPPPRKPSEILHFVTALYDFGGQGEGDLVFKEGDKIRVVKKTESTDDWWQGELRGVKGMFPANYCQ